MLRSLLAVTAFALAAEAHAGEDADSRLLTSHASAGLGVEGVGYAATGGRWGDLFLAPDVAGTLVLGGLVLDGDVLLSVPTAPGGASAGVSVTARLGYSGQRWAVLAGPLLQASPGTSPALQWLPSVRGQYSFGGWGLSAGLFDQHGLAIAHLSADLGDYSVGYVAPLGARAAATFRVGPSLALRAEGLLVFAFNTQVAYLAVSGVFSPEKLVGGAP